VPARARSRAGSSSSYFKRGFGGCLEELHSAEMMLSPLPCRFQERIVLPAWKRMYPWYLSLVGRAA